MDAHSAKTFAGIIAAAAVTTACWWAVGAGYMRLDLVVVFLLALAVAGWIRFS